MIKKDQIKRQGQAAGPRGRDQMSTAPNKAAILLSKKLADIDLTLVYGNSSLGIIVRGKHMCDRKIVGQNFL